MELAPGRKPPPHRIDLGLFAVSRANFLPFLCCSRLPSRSWTILFDPVSGHSLRFHSLHNNIEVVPVRVPHKRLKDGIEHSFEYADTESPLLNSTAAPRAKPLPLDEDVRRLIGSDERCDEGVSVRGVEIRSK